jgi:hypothetical protein
MSRNPDLMKKRSNIRYTDEPIGKVKVISDFLPSPEELALKDEIPKPVKGLNGVYSLKRLSES